MKQKSNQSSLNKAPADNNKPDVNKVLASYNDPDVTKPLPSEDKEGLKRVMKEASGYMNIHDIEEDISTLNLTEKIHYLDDVIRQNSNIKGSQQIEEVKKWAIEKKEEFEIRAARLPKENKDVQRPDQIAPLDDRDLKNIFYASKIDNFLKLEEILYNRRHIDEKKKWQNNAPELVALVLVLKSDKYFKNNVSDKQIKDFFQKRYQINISQQFKPSKRHKAERHKSQFTSILNNP